MAEPLIEEIKKRLGIESDEELIEKLREAQDPGIIVAKRQIKRWYDTGFRPSTELLIILLIEKIDKLIMEIKYEKDDT